MIRSVVSNGRMVRSEWTGPYEEYDVIVAGGGTAGAIAAIVAAEHGMKTLVVERSNCCGESAPAGLSRIIITGSGTAAYLDRCRRQRA